MQTENNNHNFLLLLSMFPKRLSIEEFRYKLLNIYDKVACRSKKKTK